MSALMVANQARKQVFKKGGRKKNPVGQSITDVADIAWKGFKIARRLNDMVNVEYKYLTTDITAGSVNYNGSAAIILNTIAEGTGENERTGQSIKMQNLTLRGYCSNNAQALVRVIVIIDKANTMSALNFILSSTGSVNAPNSFYSQDTRFNKKVLYDKLFPLTVGGGLLKPMALNIPLNIHANFQAGSSTVTTNAIKIFVVSDIPPASSVGFTGIARLSYTDN